MTGIAVAKITQLLDPETRIYDSVGTPGTTTVSKDFANTAAKVASNYVATSLGLALTTSMEMVYPMANDILALPRDSP